MDGATRQLPAPAAAPVEERIPAADGRLLVASRFPGVRSRTTGGTTADVVVVAGGAAIPQRFYADFAAWLASQGPTVLTFDYRGVGGSRVEGDLRRRDLRFRDWGELDVDAVLRHARERADGRLLYVGHSAGGQVLGLAGARTLPARIATVACHAGWWGYSPVPERWKLWSYWHLLFPVLLRTVGHLPASRLGLGEDLPAGVLAEWMRWCRDPRYLYGDPTLDSAGFADVTAPLRAVHVADDVWATRPGVEAMHRGYRSAPVEVVTLDPTEVGLPPMGHLGFFRRRTAAAAWPLVGDWLLAQEAVR